MANEKHDRSSRLRQPHDGKAVANTEAALSVEKARQDSAVKSAPQTGETQKALTAADSLVALKERELADARRQREKARLNLANEQRREFAVIVSAHQEVVNRRAYVEQKRTEAVMLENQRKKLQQDSAITAAHYNPPLAWREAKRFARRVTSNKRTMNYRPLRRSDRTTRRNFQP